MTAGATYIPITTTTVSGSSTSQITFSSIPQTYTDLVLTGSWSGTDYLYFQFNGDTGSNYSMSCEYGITGAGSYKNNGRNFIDNNVTYTNFSGNIEFNIMNYTNSTTYKTQLFRYNDAITSGARLSASLWLNTSPITSVTIYDPTSGLYFTAGSIFTLYGIASA